MMGGGHQTSATSDQRVISAECARSGRGLGDHDPARTNATKQFASHSTTAFCISHKAADVWTGLLWPRSLKLPWELKKLDIILIKLIFYFMYLLKTLVRRSMIVYISRN